jgi:saccharopine dehydrogenase-like NADP-dependent oxidoreductase
LANKKKIERSGITVIPGCGFSPGLVNLILGRELAPAGRPRRITVKAGSLSRRRHFFPFLWCFEDLVLEHRIDSWQLVAGKKVRYPPFAGYQRERFFGIEAESYLSASGFENLLEKSKVRDFTCRVVRPLGFEVFFRFLQNQGFLDGHNACSTKQIVESHREDNITMAEIVVEKGGSGTEWLLKSFSRRQGRLNSMQKITAIVPATIGICLLQGRIRRKGLVFMEDIGSDQGIFSVFERTLRNNGILMQRRKRRA